VKVGVSAEEIEKAIMKTPGKFTTARRVYTSFSSRSRPTAQAVQRCMEKLQAEGLGSFSTVNKLKVFLKKGPNEECKSKLADHGISLEEYSACYHMDDERITSKNKESILEHLQLQDRV